MTGVFWPGSLGNLPHPVAILQIISMKAFIVAAIRCSLVFVLSALAYADSAQWNLNPTSGDWNTAANWTPITVPNGPADIATFALSNTTNVSITANTEINGITFTPAATNPYIITASPGFTLTLSGTGIRDNSGTTQNFLAASGDPSEFGQIVFTNSASAGSANIVNEGGGTGFFNSSTAGNALIITDSSSFTEFSDISTAGNAIVITAGLSPVVEFFDSSTAGNADIGTGDFSSFLEFFDSSTAGSATIHGGGSIDFLGSSTAGSASIQIFDGFIDFSDSSDGGTAQIDLEFDPNFGPAALFIHAPGVTIGSIEGVGDAFLGPSNLTVGSNNLSTIFSGIIEDGGFGGSLTKIGTGTLVLAGANTYTGNTHVNGGALQVDASISSNTSVNRGGTLAGSGTINGDVTNGKRGTVSPGGALGLPGVLTVANNYTQMRSATLLIQIGGADASRVSVLDVQGNANLNGFLNPVLVNGFVPAIGQSFTFLSYASVTGSFSHIRNQVFDHGRKRWLLAYNPTSAVLTVIKNGAR